MTQQEIKRSLLKRITLKTGSIMLTAGFFVIAGGLVWQGSNVIAERANAVAPPLGTEAVLVRATEIVMQDHYVVPRVFTGQIEAPRSVNVAFETAGTIDSIRFEEGEAVEAGDVLAVLDERLLKADLVRLNASKDALKAQRELAVLINQRQSELRKKGFASNQVADQSRLSLVEIDARLAEMDATILAAEIRLEKATIRAPFSGKVDQRLVDPGSTVGNGQAILTLVEDDAPVFRVGIDPELAQQLASNERVAVQIGDRNFNAEIISILPKVDPVTRTRTVRAILRSPIDLAFGLTGKLRIEEQISRDGAWVPLEAIEDGVRGLWTVKTIKGGEDLTIGVEAVEILHADEESAFVRGTFAPGSKIVVGGLHRVVPGQYVRIAE